ncbi:uncharacterized protein TNCV_4936831 [Trichonephila clavipes]|nr:uncharacterized protein TNCV_4936831 [Trichonephila clavipes]
MLEVLAKSEEKYSCKKMQGSRNRDNVERREWNELRMSTDGDKQKNWRISKVLYRPSNNTYNYGGNYETGRQRNQWIESRNGLNRDDRRFDRGYQSGNRVQSENFSRGDRRSIRHVKTVVYRPQANRTERVNRDLVQMIVNYANDQHDTWNKFLREFAYAFRKAVNKTTGKNPEELFLGRKLIIPFQKLLMVSDGTEFVVGDIEKLFDEAR